MLALVLLSRTLIPAGYMIAPAGGWAVLTPCEGPAFAAAADHRGHHPPAKPEPPCAYAALASPPLPPAAPLFAAPVLAPEVGTPAWLAPSPAPAGSASLPPPSTGPPVLV
ncbi:MAG TPA: hypothetical protein VEA60_07865 [Allosphingosinicella sp.]|nr:hypothetical protein [Allosphingosinicella sp.]